jgi:hypothetical protein
MKRSRVKPMSDKRRAANIERKRLMVETFGPENSWTCWFKNKAPELALAGPCMGNIHGHEALKSSRGGSRLDMANVVLVCDYHNGWIETEPLLANRLGLAQHNWEKKL